MPINIVPHLMGVKIILQLFIPGLNVLGVHTCVGVDKILAVIDRAVTVCRKATDPSIAPPTVRMNGCSWCHKLLDICTKGSSITLGHIDKTYFRDLPGTGFINFDDSEYPDLFVTTSSVVLTVPSYQCLIHLYQTARTSKERTRGHSGVAGRPENFEIFLCVILGTLSVATDIFLKGIFCKFGKEFEESLQRYMGFFQKRICSYRVNTAAV